MDFRLRPMEESDLDATARLLWECYGTRGGCYHQRSADTRFLRASLAADGAHNLVAVSEDGSVVGYTCAIRPRGRLAGCGPTAVHADHWGSGLYALLVMQTVRAARERGVGLVRHQVVFIRPIFGMVYARVKMTFTGETYVKLERSPRGRVPAPAAHEVAPMGVEDLAEVVAFDRAHFVDADRAPDFTSVLGELGGRGWLIRRAGELRGFVFSCPGLIIGPLAALDDAAAIDALRAATAHDQAVGEGNTIHVNVFDRPLIEEALRLGYQFIETSVVMERSFDGGPYSSPRRPYCIGLFGVP